MRVRGIGGTGAVRKHALEKIMVYFRKGDEKRLYETDFLQSGDSCKICVECCPVTGFTVKFEERTGNGPVG